MTLYLCTRSDDQYPRGCIYDYLILPVKECEIPYAKLYSLPLPLERTAFFDIWPLSPFLLSFSSFFLSSHLLRYYSHDENEKKSHMNRYLPVYG